MPFLWYFLHMEEFKAERTKVTPQRMALAMYDAYWRYFRSWPNRDTIRVLLAHWALETGWGKWMWCYNVGNVKSHSGDDHDYCFFKCNEILIKPVAERLLVEDPTRVQITSYRSDDTCIVWFLPKHPWSRFRAFKTLEEGVYHHLKLLVQKFNKAWPHAVAGDPEEYCYALKEQRYFTADLSSYKNTFLAVFDKLDALEVPDGPVLTSMEKERVLGSVSLSLTDMVEDIYRRDLFEVEEFIKKDLDAEG